MVVGRIECVPHGCRISDRTKQHTQDAICLLPLTCAQDYEKDEAAQVSHQPVKPEFTRKKVRKATGYAKFNFSGTSTAKCGVGGGRMERKDPVF